MLEYEWGTPSPSHVLFPSSTGDGFSTPAAHHHSTPTLHPYPAPTDSPQTLPYFYGLQHPTHFHPDIDPRALPGASYQPPPPHPHPSMISSLDLDSAAASYMMIPKPKPGSHPPFYECHGHHHHPCSGIGLNLGLGTGRTYFSLADEDFVTRLYRRSSGGAGGFGVAGNPPRCQAEGCNADLTHAKHYHRRHKVCDFHSKASTVVAAGITQRFCQQCSRFHLLTEFDNGKRSCRRRLADHNRRRRKSNQPQASQERRPSQNTATSSFDNPPRSAADSVTVAVSPGRMEERRSNSYKCSPAASSSVSTPPSTSMFY